MHIGGAFALTGKVHEFKVMAIAAFSGVVCLEPPPLVLGQFTAHIEKFFPGIDRSEHLAPHLLGSLHFAGNLVRPLMRDVTVRTGGSYAGAIGVVNGFL
ncbi:hypothetical protein D9M73_184440 [compost metagenome]